MNVTDELNTLNNTIQNNDTVDNFDSETKVEEISSNNNKQEELLIQDADDRVKEIAQRYLKINKFFFGWGVYIILGLFLILIIRKLYPVRDEGNSSIELTNEEKILQYSIKQSREQILPYTGFNLIIQQGPISVSQNIFSSINNLVTYQGFVLPRKSSISIGQLGQSGLPLYTESLIETHTLQDIDIYLKNIIYNNMIFQGSEKIPQLLSDVKSVADYLNLGCINYDMYAFTLCEKVIHNSLPKLELYNLSQDAITIQDLGKRLKDTEYKEQYCKYLYNNIEYSKGVYSKLFNNIEEICGSEFVNKITQINVLVIVNDELSKQGVPDAVVGDEFIIYYKLVSLMQEIYNESTRGNYINELRIRSYITYLSNILKEKGKINKWYADVITRYNNSFLIPLLTKQSTSTKLEIATANRQNLILLKEINEGSIIKGITPLQSLISNFDFGQDTISYNNGSSLTGQIEESIKDQFEKLYNFPNYVINIVTQENENTLQLQGRIRLTNHEILSNNSAVNMLVKYTNSRFLVQSITMPNYSNVAEVANKSLQTKPLSVMEVYDLILSIKPNKDNVIGVDDVCVYFSNHKDIKNCTSSTIQFIKGGIEYDIVYSTIEGVISYTISNKSLEEKLKQVYGAKPLISKNPISMIEILLQYQYNDKEEDTTIKDQEKIGGLQDIQLQKNFSEIGARISTIEQNGDTTIVHFTIQSYNFVAIYNKQQQEIVNLGMKNNTELLTVRNFKFSFLTETSENKNLWKNDTKTFLLQYDPLLVRRL